MRPAITKRALFCLVHLCQIVCQIPEIRHIPQNKTPRKLEVSHGVLWPFWPAAEPIV